MSFLDEIIKRHTQTEVGKALYTLLKMSFDDKEFIAGTLSDLETDSDKQKMVDYISTGHFDSSDILLKSLELKGWDGKPLKIED